VAMEQMRTGMPTTRSFVETAEFLQRIFELPSVDRIRFQQRGDLVHLWVCTRTEDLQDNARVFELQREFRRDHPDILFDLDLLPLDEVDEGDIPSSMLVITRPV
jgi:hypothetical protein